MGILFIYNDPLFKLILMGIACGSALFVWFLKIEISSKKIPTLIRVDFKKNNHEYHWIIEPNIKYAYQQ